MTPDSGASIGAARRIVRGACPHDCPDTCALVVTVEDGRAVDVRGAPDHPPTGGALCTKVAHYLDRTYSPERVLHPMRRVGRKGEGRFERISWDAALATIAERFAAIAASPDGPQAIVPYSYAGTMGLLQYGSMDRRFFHRLGASLLDRTICATAGKAGWAATIGASIGTDVERFVDSRLILIWGSNPVASNLHLWSRAQEAKRRGAKLIAIDPYRSATAEKCDEHIALRTQRFQCALLRNELQEAFRRDAGPLGEYALQMKLRDTEPVCETGQCGRVAGRQFADCTCDQVVVGMGLGVVHRVSVGPAAAAFHPVLADRQGTAVAEVQHGFHCLRKTTRCTAETEVYHPRLRFSAGSGAAAKRKPISLLPARPLRRTAPTLVASHQGRARRT